MNGRVNAVTAGIKGLSAIEQVRQRPTARHAAATAGH